MATELDDVNQQRVLQEMRRIYTETVVDHVLHPRNFGSLPDADGFASVTTAGGDTIKMWLRIKDELVVAASFWTDACAATVASLSMVTELVRGRTITEALRASQYDVLEALGGLPSGNVHCALQAASVLKEALRDYQVIRKEPWKKSYRRY